MNISINNNGLKLQSEVAMKLDLHVVPSKDTGYYFHNSMNKLREVYHIKFCMSYR